MLSVKHTVRSRGDKKPTILNSEIQKLVPGWSNNDITLYYHDYNCSIQYHQGDIVGKTWYANSHFPDQKMLLPLVGIPIYYNVSVVKDENYKPVSMNLNNEFEAIRVWARTRGLYERGDKKTQYIKLMEEMGELSRAILKEQQEEIQDAIGDIVVVLTNLSELSNTKIETCINDAYQVIANRKGQMINGTFVKE